MSPARGLLLPVGFTYPAPDPVTIPEPVLGEWGFVTPAPTSLVAPGQSILPVLAQPGDQIIVLADSATPYTLGEVLVDHAGGDDSYDSRLIVLAETPYGVTIDLADTGFHANNRTLNIVFGGINFINGLIWLINDTSNLDFWYCDIQSDPDEWITQYEAAGGTDGVLNTTIRNAMANPFPSGVRMTGVGVNHIGFYGCDLHNFGDDAFFMTKAIHITIEGCRVWDVDGQFTHTDYDSWWHSDALQITDTAGPTTVSDSSFGRHWQVGGLGGPSVLGLAVSDVWIYYPDIAQGAEKGWYLNAGYFNGVERRVTGSFTGANRYFDGGAMSTAILEQIRSSDGSTSTRSWPTQARHTEPTRIDMEDESTITVAVPAGVTPVGGVITDSEVTNNALNPANIWRLANPPESLFDFFGWPEP